MVEVIVQKSGVFPNPITGTLTTTAGTAGELTVHLDAPTCCW